MKGYTKVTPPLPPLFYGVRGGRVRILPPRCMEIQRWGEVHGSTVLLWEAHVTITDDGRWESYYSFFNKDVEGESDADARRVIQRAMTALKKYVGAERGSSPPTEDQNQSGSKEGSVQPQGRSESDGTNSERQGAGERPEGGPSTAASLPSQEGVESGRGKSSASPDRSSGSACLGNEPSDSDSDPGRFPLENAPTDSQESVGEGIGGLDPAPESDPREASGLVGGEESEGQDPRSGEAVPSSDGALEQAPAPCEKQGNMFQLSSRGWGRGQSSTHAKRRFGGIHGRLSHARPERKLVLRLQRALVRMVGGETSESGRWSSRRVAIKTAGYLRPLNISDRRIEDGRPAILVLADVSGSMSAFAAEVLRLAVAAGALGVRGADVISVAHSNGFPSEWSINGGKVKPLPGMEEEEALRWYKDVLAQYNVQAVVAAADWDGAWLYQQLVQKSQVQRLYWLDVYSCSRMAAQVVPFPPKWIGLSGKDRTIWESVREKVKYALACGTAVEAVSMLEQMVR